MGRPNPALDAAGRVARMVPESGMVDECQLHDDRADCVRCIASWGVDATQPSREHAYRENLTIGGRQALKALLVVNKRMNTACLLEESLEELWDYCWKG